MDPKEQSGKFREVYNSLREEIGKVIVGQDAIVDGTLNALFANGHVLLELSERMQLSRTLASAQLHPFAPTFPPRRVTRVSAAGASPPTRCGRDDAPRGARAPALPAGSRGVAWAELARLEVEGLATCFGAEAPGTRPATSSASSASSPPTLSRPRRARVRVAPAS